MMGGHSVESATEHYDRTHHTRYLTYSTEVYCLDCEEIGTGGKMAPGMSEGAEQQDWMG